MDGIRSIQAQTMTESDHVVTLRDKAIQCLRHT
jgi:hypothetical protein